jgi:hypothetical protein
VYVQAQITTLEGFAKLEMSEAGFELGSRITLLMLVAAAEGQLVVRAGAAAGVAAPLVAVFEHVLRSLQLEEEGTAAGGSPNRIIGAVDSTLAMPHFAMPLSIFLDQYDKHTALWAADLQARVAAYEKAAGDGGRWEIQENDQYGWSDRLVHRLWHPIPPCWLAPACRVGALPLSSSSPLLAGGGAACRSGGGVAPLLLAPCSLLLAPCSLLFGTVPLFVLVCLHGGDGSSSSWWCGWVGFG